MVDLVGVIVTGDAWNSRMLRLAVIWRNCNVLQMEYSAKPPTSKLKHLQLIISLWFSETRSTTSVRLPLPLHCTTFPSGRRRLCTVGMLLPSTRLRNWWTHPYASFTMFQLGWQRRCEDCCHRSLLWCVTSHSLLAAFQLRSNQPSYIHFWTVDLIAARWRTSTCIKPTFSFHDNGTSCSVATALQVFMDSNNLTKRHSMHTVSFTAPRRLWRKSIMICYSLYIY